MLSNNILKGENLEEIFVIELYTGIFMDKDYKGVNSRSNDSKTVHKYIGELFGRPVYIHELADKVFQKEIHKKV